MPECIQCGANIEDGSSLCSSCAATGQKTADLETLSLPHIPSWSGREALRPTASPGVTIGDYELLALIASGGMGQVYRARQRGVHRVVALKMMLPANAGHESSRRRFSLEAEAAAALDHPHIVPIYQIGEDQGRPYFTMKLMEGGTLAQHAQRFLDRPREAAQLIATVARAVHFAHQRGVLHRDLKPANILMDAEGRPQVADFGLARLSGQETNLTLPEAALGTPNYMAPEQARGRAGELTTAADLYSLGAILYHLLTGLPPFRGDTPLATLRQVTDTEPVPPSTIRPATDRDLETICLKCLEKAPDRRYFSAEALAHDLERWLRHEPITARPATAYERARKWVRRRPAFATMVLVTVLAAVGLLIQENVSRSRLKDQRDRALSQEQIAKAERARAREIASRLAIQNAETEFSADNWKTALAQLARLVHDNPSNSVAVERLLFALTHRNYAPLVIPPLTHDLSIASAEFSPDKKSILTASRDGTARIWDIQTGQSLLPPLRHAADLTGARFSPDGRRVITCSYDKTARIWNAATGELLHELQHDDRVIRATFSPDGQWVATGSYDSTAKLWNAKTGELAGEPRRFEAQVARVIFSPDSKLLMAAAANKLTLWEVASGQQFGPTVAHAGYIADAVFSPDGALFATASHDKTVRVWETSTGQPLTRSLSHSGEVHSVRFSPDGQRLVSAEFYLAAHLWDSRTGQELTPPLAHSDSVLSAEFSPDGLRVVTTSLGKYLRVWDAASGQPISQPLRHGDAVTGAKFSADGRTVLSWSRDHTARLWDVQLGQALNLRLNHESGVVAVAMTSDGRRLATATEAGLTRLWDVRSGRPLRSPPPNSNMVVQVAFSPDDHLLATAAGDGDMSIWNAETCELMSTPGPHRGAPTTLIFGAKGDLFLSASWDGTARVWDTFSGMPKTPLMVHDKPVLSAYFSPDGKSIVTASHDGTAQLWDAQTGQRIAPPMRHARPVWQAHFSPDGQRVVTAAQNNLAQIWNPRTAQPLGKPLLHDAEVQQARFDPTGRFVLTGTREGTLHLWDAETSRPAAPPAKHDASIGRISFSPDGRRILSSSHDHTARIWDARTTSPLTGPLRHRKPLLRSEFSPDGRFVVTSSLDGAAIIWDVPPAPVPAPGWLGPLGEALAGQLLTPEGLHETVSATALAQLKQTLSQQTGAGFYERWSRWFFADRSSRTVSPFSDLTVPEYVAERIREDNLESLREAVILAPTNGLALARLARRLLESDPTQHPRAQGEANHLSKLAVRWAPDEPEVRRMVEAVTGRVVSE